MEGVSFVVPVHNGAACVRETLDAIAAQADGRPMEIIVVDDGGSDGSSTLLQHLAMRLPLRIVTGRRSGAAAAINAGIVAARFPIICQVDQDVVVQPGWMQLLTARLTDSTIAAAQGYYANDPDAPFCARAMNRDLELRYAAIAGEETEHVCTGNSAYRKEALHSVGLFDETLGYGYDNDMSYRLRAAGYRLAFCREARSVHRWREGLAGYLVQQYGFGYGRLDVVAKHPGRFRGDSVSPAAMMAHPLVMITALAALAASSVAAVIGGPWRPLAAIGVTLLSGLTAERLAAGIKAARRFADPTPLAFPLLHLGRDLVWVAAIVTWSARRLARRPFKPSDSMRPRPAAVPVLETIGDASVEDSGNRRPHRILCLVPAHNEAANLVAVVSEIRTSRPDIDILVVDDGSSDQTAPLLEQLDVQWLRLPERMGIGSAVRAGLRYAARLGYDVVVRMDGDGQHGANDIARLLPPLDAGADVVMGSRFTEPHSDRAGVARRLTRMALAACLSTLTGKQVTDPTSGFCALGPRAVRVLAEHHPTGYAEPELRLFLSRNALTAIETPIDKRSRLEGKTSLTPVRLTAAGARVVLAMIVVPLRCRVEAAGD